MTQTRTPSLFQVNIFDAIQFGIENLFVDAVAGSGKTTTLEEICKRLTPEQLSDAIFLAFNKAIQLELSTRLPREVWVKTFHAFAMAELKKALKPYSGNWIDDSKYGVIIRNVLDEKGYPKGDARSALDDALYQAVRFARLTLVNLDSDDALFEMCNHYDIEDVIGITGFRQLISEILERGERCAREVIDFTDMIYLPIRMNISLRKFSFVMVDEAQDLSACQRELVRRMMHPTSRLVAVGDPHQAIYGFAGAGVDSVDRIVEEFGCKVMPLSVCYRCPSGPLDLAREIVPHIEARDNAPAGTVASIQYSDIFKAVDAARGDLVMCRTNAPLVELAFELLAAGIPATIKGRDLLAQLVNLAKSVLKLPGANWDQFHSYLENYVTRQSEALGRKKGTEMQIQALQDRSAALGVIVARAQALDHRISTMNGLESFIERLYGSEKGAVVLSSVHKAKGLEADHTFILGVDMMPHRMAQTQWAVAQEYNLKYVALTRCKASLTFVALKPKEQ